MNEQELMDKAEAFIKSELGTDPRQIRDISWASGPDVFTRCYRITFDDSTTSDWIVSFDLDWTVLSAAKFNDVI